MFHTSNVLLLVHYCSAHFTFCQEKPTQMAGSFLLSKRCVISRDITKIVARAQVGEEPAIISSSDTVTRARLIVHFPLY